MSGRHVFLPRVYHQTMATARARPGAVTLSDSVETARDGWLGKKENLAPKVLEPNASGYACRFTKNAAAWARRVMRSF